MICYFRLFQVNPWMSIILIHLYHKLSFLFDEKISHDWKKSIFDQYLLYKSTSVLNLLPPGLATWHGCFTEVFFWFFRFFYVFFCLFLFFIQIRIIVPTNMSVGNLNLSNCLTYLVQLLIFNHGGIKWWSGVCVTKT